MKNIKIKVENNVSALLNEGDHVVTIKGYKETVAKTGAEQIAIDMQDAKGKFITLWLNTTGFKRYSELTEKELASGKFENSSIDPDIDGFAIDKKTGQRIEDEERTASALSIIGKLAKDAGLPDGMEASLEEVLQACVGREVGIHVEAVNGKAKVRYTQFAERVRAL
jgi:hypothetical protein